MSEEILNPKDQQRDSESILENREQHMPNKTGDFKLSFYLKND